MACGEAGEPASEVLVWLPRLMAWERVWLEHSFFSEQMKLQVRSVLIDSFPEQFLSSLV